MITLPGPWKKGFAFDVHTLSSTRTGENEYGPPDGKLMNIFISGSISIKSLPQVVLQKLDSIMRKGLSVIVGDAAGVDLLVQEYLAKNRYANVTVYCMGKPRHNVAGWQVKSIPNTQNLTGRAFFTLKDQAMAHDADYGLMVWDGKSKGTQNNMQMMKTLGKRFFVTQNEKILLA
jgi:hypothetical protein